MAVNSRLETARRQGASHLHLPLHLLRQYSGELDGFSQVGASVHSVEDALEAQAMGASYLVAGHIFPTSCKEGVPPRGLSFLKEVCQAVKIPVYAIGGINRNHVPEILAQGEMCIRDRTILFSFFFLLEFDLFSSSCLPDDAIIDGIRYICNTIFFYLSFICYYLSII